MVSTLLRSTLREIRQSLGRYLAILAIVGLGVGFFAGLRMSQPSMMATGVNYLEEHPLYDFRLISTLGFTEEDLEIFSQASGVKEAKGSVYTEFLMRVDGGDELVGIAHSLTGDINTPKLLYGRMPQAPDECLGDAFLFSEADLGSMIEVSAANDEDTLELMAYDSYKLVGIARSPLYLNFERGTSSIGSGSISGFLLMPEEAFDSDVYFEIYLSADESARAYSQEYTDLIDSRKPSLEELLEQRADIRYETLYSDALEEIRDGELELADGWEEYRTERADAEQELADALTELTDGEAEYTDGLADYEQGKIDYADGVKKLADAEQELADGRKEFEEGKAEALQKLADAKKELEDAEQEYADGLAEYEDGLKKVADGRAEMNAGGSQMADAQNQLNSAKAALDKGEADYQSASTLLQAGQLLSSGFGASSPGDLLIQTENDPATAYAVNEALKTQGSTLDEFKAGWNQAEQALGAPLTQDTLNGVRSELDAGQAQYQDGLAQYEAGLAMAAEANYQLWEAENQLKKAKEQLDEARLKLDEGWAEYYEAEAEAMQELADAEQELLDGEAEIADAKKELASAKKDLDDAPRELADARQELDDGWKEYYDGLAESEQEFADAEEELRDGEQEIADAYEELEELKKPSTYALTRKENTGYSCFENDTSIVEAISVIFPVFFFLVAALVCMTTMKRMVDEQRTQIGVLKALGYSNGQVMGKYLFYSGSAAIVGSVIGYALGSYLLPRVIWEIYGIMYGFAPLTFIFDPLLAAISFAAALLCSMGATWLSCRMELSNQAAQLIRPKAPKAGQRVFLEYITPIWKRLSFLRKVSVRNVLRYRSRLIMMILGIGGCTALLVTGFGIRDSIASIVDDQFQEITLFDYAVTFQEEQTRAQVDAYLADRGWPQDQGLLVHTGSIDISSPTAGKSVHLVISASKELDGFISLHSGEAPIPYPSVDEVVINVGLAEKLGVGIGDSVDLMDEERGLMTATVSAICDNYVFNYVYLAPETYLKQLGQVPPFQTVYINANPGADPYAESVILSDYDDVSGVSVNEASRTQINTMLTRLDLLVIVVVLCAAALAFIVLYNLTNINITERIREIATIKVLGFYRGEVASYVFREIMMLSVLGSLAGLLMGKGLHLFVMAQVQVDGMFFPCKILPSSYLLSLGLTLLFTVLITQSMRGKLNRVDMAESLKSIE